MPSRSEMVAGEVDAALEIASASRIAASEARQMGFLMSARYYLDNAKAAEGWAVARARAALEAGDG